MAAQHSLLNGYAGSEEVEFVSKNVPVIHLQRGDVFFEFPEFQRDYVWNLNDQQWLIDTILRGLPMPSWLAVKNDKLDGAYFSIVDGQQRYKTIMRFINNEFKTKTGEIEPGLKAISPGKYYDELSKYEQSKFNNYALRFDVVFVNDDSLLELIFRRYQGGKALNLAEKVYSFSGPNREFFSGYMMRNNPSVWLSEDGTRKVILTKDFFERKTDYLFTVYCYLATLDFFSPWSSEKAIRIMASRNAISSKNKQYFNDILTGAIYLFEKSILTVKTQLPGIVKITDWLRRDGLIFDRCERGALTRWMNSNVKNIQNRIGRNDSPYQEQFMYQLSMNREQTRFFSEHYSELQKESGLVFKDNNRFFKDIDKRLMWINQDGECPICHQRIDISECDAHHIDLHSNGGKTSIDNGMLIHKKCHDRIHNGREDGEVQHGFNLE